MKHTLEEIQDKIREFVRDSGCWEGSDFTHFAFEAKEMLKDLVEEVKIVNEDADRAVKIYISVIEENKRLREALNDIASWSEGSEVNSRFDEPGSAEIARKALEGK